MASTREEWVVVAAHRQDRPWQGERATVSPTPAPDTSTAATSARGRRRRAQSRLPSVFVFDNDHPCVGPGAPALLDRPPGIYRNAPATGVARVVCYSPKHNTTLAELPVGEITALLGTWRDQYLELGARPEVRHVLTFENKGEVVGVSNPHPHGQIYATNFVFKTIETEAAVSRRHYGHRRTLFQDIIRAEQDGGRSSLRERVGDRVPPVFRALRLRVLRRAGDARQPRHHVGRRDSRAGGRAQVAAGPLDNLWQLSFPYVLTLHQATDGDDHSGFHFHSSVIRHCASRTC